MLQSPFGQFLSSDTFLHRVDPRIKLIGMIVLMTAAVITNRWIGLGILMVVAMSANYVARVPLREIVRNWWVLRYFFVITLLLHSIFGIGDSLLQLPFGLAITEDGVVRGIFFVVKITVLASLIGPVMRTTHPALWGVAIERMMPKRRHLQHFALTLGLAVRFLPMLLMEAQRIRSAQIGRGLKTTGGLIQRVRSMVPLLAPLVMASFQRADNITAAMQARGYRLDHIRSQYRPLKLNPRDAVATTFVVIATAVSLWR